MLSAEELEWLAATLTNIDALLRGMADFSQYPDLLNRDDARLDALLDHVVAGVRDARLLSGKAIERVDDALSAMAEDARAAAETARQQTAATDLTPASPPPVRTVRPPEKIEQITMANPTGMRELVLVADHHAGSLQEIETMLTDEDYRVVSVQDAFEAISIYARLWAAIDLVILDFSMPGLSGDLIFDELQAINPRVAAVVSGGFTHPDKLNQMLGQGLSGFLPTKPFVKEKFIRQIQQVLAHRPHQGGGASQL